MVPLGDEAEVLCGLRNNGDEAFTVQFVQGSLNNPFMFTEYVQNVRRSHTHSVSDSVLCAGAWMAVLCRCARVHMRHGLPRRRPLSELSWDIKCVCTSGHCSSFQPSVSGQQSGQAAKRDHLNSAPVGGRVWPPPRAPVAGLAHRRDMAVSTLPQFTEKVVNRTLDAKCGPARPARALASRPIGALGGRRARTRL